MTRRLLSGIGSAPLAAVLAIVSASVTLLVAISTVSTGRVPADAGVELIAALLLAAVATSEASRPRRRDRDRRRLAKTADSEQRIGDHSELRRTEWLGIDRELR